MSKAQTPGERIAETVYYLDDGGWGGSGDPSYADAVNKAVEAAERAKGVE